MRTNNLENLDVTFVNHETKKAHEMIHRYKASTKRNIFQAYNRPSLTKVSAFDEIEKEMKRVNGRDMYITGAGSDIFSCAYVVEDDKGMEFLIYHTPSNRFAIPLL